MDGHAVQPRQFLDRLESREKLKIIRTIAVTISATVPQGQWAFTGSVALWLHAFDLDRPETRTPHDIDLLVSKEKFLDLAMYAFGSCEQATKPVSSRVFPADKSNIFQTLCPASLFGTRVNVAVDVLKSPYFGRLQGNIVNILGIPVLSLPEMKRMKEIALDDIPRSDAIGWGKTNDDLQTIEKLLKYQPRESLRRQAAPVESRRQRQSDSAPKLQFDD